MTSKIITMITTTLNSEITDRIIEALFLITMIAFMVFCLIAFQ